MSTVGGASSTAIHALYTDVSTRALFCCVRVLSPLKIIAHAAHRRWCALVSPLDVPSRIPPHNLDAERAVLGAILLEGREALPRVVEVLRPSDFYTEAHRALYQAMLTLFDRGAPVDSLTLSEELRRTDRLQFVGGPAAIALLMEEASIAAHLGSYTAIVRDMAVLRELIQTSTQIITQAFDAKDEVQTLVDDAEKRIFSLAERRLEGSALPVGKILKNTFEYIERLYERKEHVTGVATGFEKLDLETSGFQPSDFIIIAGRPSMGKTAFALNIAQHVGVTLRGTVLVLSLEMSAQQLVQRMLCSEAKVDAQAVRTGFLSSSDWHRLTAAAGRLSEAKIFIDDSPGVTVLEARAKARRMKAEHGLDLLVVDYLQLMRGRASLDNRQQEISEISRSLKALAKELNVPVVALSQLSRAVEARAQRDFRPQLSDLRECVPGDTLVLLSDGRRVPIRDLVDTAPEVLAVSPGGRIVPAKTDRVWRVGRRPVFTVKLRSGRTIRATAEHRLLSGRGWVTVAQLGVDDRLAVARKVPEPTITEQWPDRRVALLGQLIGDGSYLVHQPLRYTTSSEANSAIVAAGAREEFGCPVTRYAGRGRWHQLLISGNGDRWHPRGVNRWLRELGIFGQRSHQKRIPEDVFRLSDRQIALLLQHLWATDGTIAARRGGRGSHSVFYATNSRGLASDVAALLLRLGIVARISKTRKAAYRPVYFVAVSGARDQRRFLQTVGAFGPRVPQARRLHAMLGDRASNTNVDTLPIEVFIDVRALMGVRGVSHRRMAALRGTAYGGSAHFKFAPSRDLVLSYANLLADEDLRSMATSDLFWDRVVAVEADGEEDVFDLTVPGPASWLADGIVSHNSGALEQDADVILFLYRARVYKEDVPPDEENIAEVIIGKQRNGPIGTVKVVFLPQYARFENAADFHRQTPQPF
jgi:replicative DNA helicase